MVKARANPVIKIARVRVETSDTGQLETHEPVTVKGLQAVPVTRFDTLTDVDAGVEIDGAVPVFDSVTGKYIVRELTAQDMDIGEIDGGTF